MTFFDISRKMLKAGFYKYRLYFLCNLSATALFCCFAVISTNRTFMNASIVNSSISNNIYLPFFLSAVFLVFFLPVSCQAFLASRKQEYGVMFSLGMSRKEAFRNLLFENVIISVLALAIALAAGTVLSFLFFSVIIYAIDVHGVQWQFCPEAYKLTAVLYTVVVAVAFILNAGRLMLDKIGTLLKAQYRAEKTGKITGERKEELTRAMVETSDGIPDIAQKAWDWYKANKEDLLKCKRIIVIGCDSCMGAMLEGTLKILEAARYSVTGYELEEFMHGIYHAIDKDTYILYLGNKSKHLERMVHMMKYFEEERHAHNYMITSDESLATQRNLVYPFKEDGYFSSMEYVVPMQVLARKMSMDMGIDCNIPSDPLFHKKMGSYEYS